MKRMVTLHVVPFGLLVLLCLPPPVAAQATHTVEVAKSSVLQPQYASPKNLTIQVGDTVRWSNSYSPYHYSYGSKVHNVTADDLSFASPTSHNFVFAHTFTKAGEILYHCTLHSSPWQNENGRIIVQGGGGGSASNLALQRVHAAGGSYKPGDVIPLDLTIENAGGQASPEYSVTYYASAFPNARIDASDIVLGTDNRPSLNAGQSSSFSGTATLPADIPNGYYFIGAIINVSDANSDNNIGISDVRVLVELQINEGLNDAWSNPATPGQGFFVNVFPDTGQVFLAWFTYDTERPADSASANIGEPGHRWLTAFGPYLGSQAVLDVEITQGGVFNAANPAPTQHGDGTILLEFSNCNEGTVTYSIPSIGREGVIPIRRISSDNTPACEALAGASSAGTTTAINTANKVANGGSNSPAVAGSLINRGLNDAWKNPATPGQGFFINVFPNLGQMFLAWFTYDTTRPPGSVQANLGDSGHRWLTAFGPFTGNQAVLDIEVTQGGIFDAASPEPTQHGGGTVIVDMTDCESGTITYDIDSANLQGEIPIQRIAPDNVPLCQSLAAQSQQSR